VEFESNEEEEETREAQSGLETSHSFRLNIAHLLRAANSTLRRCHAEKKTHLEATALLSLLADLYRDGVSRFSNAGAATSRDEAWASAIDAGEEARSD
jgi:hypothetical protein